MRFAIDELRSLTILKGLPDSTLTWLCDHGTRIDLSAGDRMFKHGEPAEFMFLVVAGTIQRYEDIGGQRLVVATTAQGQVTGMLPFSRMTHYPGDTIAVEPSRALRVNSSDFTEMLTVSHELGQRLVAEMSNRVRGDVRLEQQREKMMALGRLSAGLAHELNNPTAAIRRTAASLAERLSEQRGLTLKLTQDAVGVAAIKAAEAFLKRARESDPPGDLSLLQLSDREEEFSTWLDEREIENAEDLAATFTDTGLRPRDLEEFTGALPENLLANALGWVAGHIEIDRMVAEIASSAQRVSELVASVKIYSHMDRSSEHKPTDVREGIDNTLTMFGHRLKEKNIQLSRRYPDDLPTIPANAGELNQVWTNLIDNAIDAVSAEGRLGIEIDRDEWGIVVKVTDDGGGIPDDIRHRIFDPFFTTKDVGEGTGLGLDIARRIVSTHGGQIEVHSSPGRTEMVVRLPGAERDDAAGPSR